MKQFKLDDLETWTEVGKGVEFTEKKRRTIRFQCNSEGTTNLYWESAFGDKTFLAAVEGSAIVTFKAFGKGKVIAKGDKCWWKATEADWRPVLFVDDPDIFTKVRERRQRNPELEYMMHKMQQNLDARLGHMERLHEQRTKQAERRAQEAEQLARESAEERAGGGSPNDAQTGDNGSAETGGVSEQAD